MTAETRKHLGRHWASMDEKHKLRYAGMEQYYNEFKEEIDMEGEEAKPEAPVEEEKPSEDTKEEEED